MTRIGLAFLLACMTACCATTPDSPKPHTLRMEFDNGLCSGTATGPNEITTATHCLTGRLVSVNKQPVTLQHSRKVGADVTLLYVDRQFPAWAQWSDRRPEQGDRIYYWGNPSGLADMYRVGYVAGFRGETILADVEIGQGDSGAAVFDDTGRMVGVVSAYGVTGPFRLAIIVRPNP